MNRQQHIAAALTLIGGLAAAGVAQARDVDIQWRVAIPGPVSVVIGSPAPRVLPPVVVVPPRVVVPVHGRGYGWGDADRDGIPNRYDRVYNPRWDRDGDGIPNRYDRHDNRWDRRWDHRRGHDHRWEDHRWEDRRDDRRDDRHDDRRGR